MPSMYFRAQPAKLVAHACGSVGLPVADTSETIRMFRVLSV